MARTYKRDARGRFASGGGSSEGGSKGKTLKRERLATVAGAFETYDMGTGRRMPRRSTASR